MEVCGGGVVVCGGGVVGCGGGVVVCGGGVVVCRGGVVGCGGGGSKLSALWISVRLNGSLKFSAWCCGENNPVTLN